MSRDSLQHKELESTTGGSAQHVDVDAEHDPKVSRRASNAALEREAAQHHADPSQAYADQHVIQAIQAQMKLTAARMHAGAANINGLLKSDTSGPAGNEPMLQMLEAQISDVNGELDHLNMQIMRVPNVVRGTLNVELGLLNGAFHGSWAPALNRVYSYTHDQDGNLRSFAQGMQFSVTPSQLKIRDIFQALGVDQADVTSVNAPRLKDPAKAEEQRDDELKAAELEAVKAGMASVETALDLVRADLHSSVSDQSKEALDLTVSVEQLLAVLEPINPDHIGKISKLPVLIKQVEGLQAEIMQMKDADQDKGKALAPKIGHGTQLSTNLRKLKAKIGSIEVAHKSNAKHHH